MKKTIIDVFCGIPMDELHTYAQKAGFDGFFSGEIYANDLPALEAMHERQKVTGMIWETSHSTIHHSRTIWDEGAEGDEYINVLCANIDNCRRFSIPILVVHITPIFQNHPKLSNGIPRLKKAVEYAESAGVKIAFENTGSAEYLFETLDYFKGEHVGFCYDCGHEAADPEKIRYLPILGKRLLCTHLHDNDGIDDQHRLPYDGTIDFDRICRELIECNYKGPLTLELAYDAAYATQYTKEEFVMESYRRIMRLNRRLEELR